MPRKSDVEYLIDFYLELYWNGGNKSYMARLAQRIKELDPDAEIRLKLC